MPLPLSVGDFIALSTLTLTLYRSFKSAPGEFSEISVQLQLLHTVIVDLIVQAQEKYSPLKRNEATRGEELKAIHNALMETMTELEDPHKRYKKLGRIKWSLFQQGQGRLLEMRGKLTVQISALNAFVGSLTISALGRMESMLQRIYDLLDGRARGSIAAAQSVLSAASDHQKAWARLELDLRTEGIPLEYVQDNRQAITSILWSVVESNNLAGEDPQSEITVPTNIATEDDGIYPDDSASQVHNISTHQYGIPELLNPISEKYSLVKGKVRQGRELSAREEKTRILIMNHTGFDVKGMSTLA